MYIYMYMLIHSCKVTWSHVLCMVAWPTWSHQSCPVCDDSILVGLIHVLQVIFYDSDWNPTVDQQVCRTEAHIMYMYTYMIWVAAGFSQLSKYILKPCVRWLPRGRPSFTGTAMNKQNISLSVATPLRSYRSIPSGILTAHTE